VALLVLPLFYAFPAPGGSWPWMLGEMIRDPIDTGASATLDDHALVVTATIRLRSGRHGRHGA
jgi:hypothetical protein